MKTMRLALEIEDFYSPTLHYEKLATMEPHAFYAALVEGRIAEAAQLALCKCGGELFACDGGRAWQCACGRGEITIAE